MKTIKNISFFCVVALVFFACSKNDGPTRVPVAKVSIPKITKKSGSVAIDVVNLANFSAEFEVGLMFPNDERPTKLDVVVRKNGSASNVKVFKENISTYPTSFTINSSDVTALFGAAPVLDDTYDVSVDVYMADGKKYQAYPTVGVGYASGVNNLNGSSTSVRYAAICAYNPDMYQGDFEVVTDDFQDTAPGDILTFTKIDATHFSFYYRTVGTPGTIVSPTQPIMVTINPLDNSINIPTQTLGAAWSWEPSYKNPSVKGAGTVYPCDKSITFEMTWGLNGGGSTFSGGPFILKLKKK